MFSLVHAQGETAANWSVDLVSISPPSITVFVGIILAICYMWGFMFGLVCLGYFNWIVAFTSVFALV